jgi:hypothetical protein
MSSNGIADAAMYGLAWTSDLSLVAGTAAHFIPKVESYSAILTASGITARTAPALETPRRS